MSDWWEVLWTVDAAYLAAMLVTVSAGPLFRRLPTPTLRRWFGSLLGVLVLVLMCGVQAAHPLACAASNVLLLRLVPARHVHLASLGFSLAYLAWIRLLDAYWMPLSPLVNLVQMISCLRVVGLAFELHTTWRMRRDAQDTEPSDDVKAKMTWAEVTPSAADLMHYTFFYVGIITGPYYTYVTYQHCINGTFWPWTDCTWPALRRCRLLPMYAAIFLLLGHLWPIEYVETMAIAERSLWYRVWYIYPSFSHYRMRLYIGFALSEVACITHGLGAFPAASECRAGQGPTRPGQALALMQDSSQLAAARYDFETVHNIRELRVELDVTMTTVLKQWNTTVQYWLYAVVYRSTPGTKVVRALVTMLVSAFWHGIQSGYYLSLLSCPPYMVVEDVWERLVRRRLPAQHTWMYDVVSWFLRVSVFSYLCMGFLLLGSAPTLAYWHSIYYVGHVVPAVLFVVGVVAARLLPRAGPGSAAHKAHSQ